MDEQIICRKCGKPFADENINKSCKCPYDEEMEAQLRDERNKIIMPINHKYKGRQVQERKIPSFQNGRMLNK